jgi:hypothetical protein
VCSWCMSELCLCNGCVALRDEACPRCHHFRVFFSVKKGGVCVVD